MDQHKIDTIDANQDHVVCPKDMVNPEEYLGYKDGYSDEAIDQLEWIQFYCLTLYSYNWFTIVSRQLTTTQDT